MIRASTHAFASAYLFKSNFPVLIPMIRETAQGVTSQAHLICSALLAPLTDAERSVLRHLLGEDVRLHSSSKTISNQQTGILRKLGPPRQKGADAHLQRLRSGERGDAGRLTPLTAPG